MSFFRLILKARKLEKAQLEYHEEKIRSIEIFNGAKPNYTIGQRIRLKKIKLKRKVKSLFKRWIQWPQDSWIERQYILLVTDGSFENFVLKSFVGFLAGTLLTYMFFIFFVFQLHFTLASVTLFCSIFGVILTIGLAFSLRLRCVVFLLLPQFFSKRGRQALMAYAFILVITGPAKNTLYNIGILSESLACTQEHLKASVKVVIDMVKRPFVAIRDGIAKIIKSIKDVADKIKQALLSIKRIVLSIVGVIKSAFQWLGSIISICNKKLGTPFERCQKVFEGAITDCQAKLGPLFSSLCNIVYVAEALCYIVKPIDFICVLAAFISDAIVGTVRKKIKKFSNHVKAMFYVKVNFSHKFHFETNKNETYKNIAKGMVAEIKSRTDGFVKIFDWMSLITTFFFLFLLLKVLNYRYKWLTKDRFDNKYLTDNFREIDIVRTRMDKETLLPLNRREHRQYIPLSSITLISMERIRLVKSIVFLVLASFKICVYILIDYSLYWVLSTIRYHGRFKTRVPTDSVGVHISGSGYLAELYRNIVRTISPEKSDSLVDSLPCLPDPVPPDYDRYIQIAVLVSFCWIMAIFEPYGLRLRQIIMGYYHPNRAQQRAVWLYNHIIRSRGNFLKYARRQLRRKYGMVGDQGVEHVTFKERIFAICPLLNIFFPQNQKMCLLCGDVEKDVHHVECPTPGCIGRFCIQCFADLQNLCTICRAPMEYGDLSDMSEEKDSSEDEVTDVKSIPFTTTKFPNNSGTWKNRDDSSTQVFHESLRGGGNSPIQSSKFSKQSHSPISSPSSTTFTESSLDEDDDGRSSEIEQGLLPRVSKQKSRSFKSKNMMSQFFSAFKIPSCRTKSRKKNYKKSLSMKKNQKQW